MISWTKKLVLHAHHVITPAHHLVPQYNHLVPNGSQTSSVAIDVRLLGVTDPKSNLNGKNECCLEK